MDKNFLDFETRKLIGITDSTNHSKDIREKYFEKQQTFSMVKRREKIEAKKAKGISQTNFVHNQLINQHETQETNNMFKLLLLKEFQKTNQQIESIQSARPTSTSNLNSSIIINERLYHEWIEIVGLNEGDAKTITSYDITLKDFKYLTEEEKKEIIQSISIKGRVIIRQALTE